MTEWGTDIDINSTRASGKQSIRLVNPLASLWSDFVPAEALKTYFLQIKVKGTNTVRNLTVEVKWYNTADALISTSTPINLSAGTGVWVDIFAETYAPAGTVNARIRVYSTNVGTPSFLLINGIDFWPITGVSKGQRITTDQTGMTDSAWDVVEYNSNTSRLDDCYDTTNFYFNVIDSGFYCGAASVNADADSGTIELAQLRFTVNSGGGATEIVRGQAIDVFSDSTYLTPKVNFQDYYLSRGDQVSVELYAVHSGSTNNIKVLLNSGTVENSFCYLEMKSYK